MKKTFFTFILSLISIYIFAQNEILVDRDIPKFDRIIKSLEKDYRKSETPSIKSLPQTTADHFQILTRNPDAFINSLKRVENFEQLIKENPNLQIDRDLLVIKNQIVNSKKEKLIEIKSFEIGESQGHSIEIKLNDPLNNNIKFLYTTRIETWGENKGASIIQGFYLHNEFKSINIPKKYSDWINYTDILVKPQTSIFTNKGNILEPTFSARKTIIDSLTNYFDIKTNKPLYKEGIDQALFIKEMDIWQPKKVAYSDSLFKYDKGFKNLLLKSLSFAEEGKLTNGDLEDFTANLISKERALNLMRLNQQVGTCSFDNSPLIQQKRIATLAAQTQNWEVFIKSFLNVMNDYAERIANSNIASQARETYIEEIVKLDLDLDKILLGSNFRISDTINKHYFSDGDKIAKAYSNLDNRSQNYFIKTLTEISTDEAIDPFNKLHFYNTFKNFQYYLKDSIKIKGVETNILSLTAFLPNEIKSRIENPHKQLCDLLHNEKEQLEKFEIKSSSIGNIYSYSYGGDCWQAELEEKGQNNGIVYSLTMPIGEIITPLENFLEKKNDIKSRVESHQFLQKISNASKEKKLYVEFVKDKSFINYQNQVKMDMPQELLSNLDFKDAISVSILYNGRNVRFILLNNNNLMLLDIQENFTLPGYSFKDLMTNKKESFFNTSFKSFKLFNEKGAMLN